MTSSDLPIFPVDSVAVSRLAVDAAGTESKESTDPTGLGGDMNRSDDILLVSEASKKFQTNHARIFSNSDRLHAWVEKNSRVFFLEFTPFSLTILKRGKCVENSHE